VIEARALRKRFGRRVALQDVSFHVGRGEVVGFLGPNGAGKTTTLRILAGVFPPSGGSALVAGLELARAPLAARRCLGYAPERPALPLDMTVDGALTFVAGLRDVAPRARRRAAEAALERTRLGDLATERIARLSRGTRQRVGLAAALVGNPPALLLDEPLAGLDPAQVADARRLLRDLGRDHAVLVSSHALADVEQTADRVVVLHRGRVAASGTPGELAARLRTVAAVEVEADAPADLLTGALGRLPGVRGVATLSAPGARTRCRVEVDPGRDVRPALAACVLARGWQLFALAAVEPSLEDAFLALVDRASDA